MKIYMQMRGYNFGILKEITMKLPPKAYLFYLSSALVYMFTLCYALNPGCFLSYI